MNPGRAVRLVLLDSGGANLGSVQAAFGRLGVDAPVTSDARTIARATHVVLPGVGHAARAMQRLRENGLASLIPRISQPLLGICVGMQLLFEWSEEGNTECLGILPGAVGELPPSPAHRIPHMGWNHVRTVPLATAVEADRTGHPLLSGLDDAWLYFVHGFATSPGDSTIATSEHGSEFSAAVARENVLGVQFHPERSSRAGAQLLQNFLTL